MFLVRVVAQKIVSDRRFEIRLPLSFQSWSRGESSCNGQIEIRAIETAQVIEELIAMAKQFQAAANRGEELGLTAEEMAFYDALAANEASVRELGDATLRKIGQELTAKLKASNSVDWYVRESVRAKLRIMVKTVLKRWKYPPDGQDAATTLVLDQAKELSEVWAARG